MSGMRFRSYPTDDYDKASDERRRQERLKKKREERTEGVIVDELEEGDIDPDVILQEKKREKHERKKAKARKKRPVLWDGSLGDDLDMMEASDDDGQ
jgi:hypothetical protein